jgi:hypothetical protein
VSACADVSHVANAASFALLTAVAALRYAAASCVTVGVGAGVAGGVGVAAASGADGVGVAAGADVEAAGWPVGATAGDPDD